MVDSTDSTMTIFPNLLVYPDDPEVIEKSKDCGEKNGMNRQLALYHGVVQF